MTRPASSNSLRAERSTGAVTPNAFANESMVPISTTPSPILARMAASAQSKEPG